MKYFMSVGLGQRKNLLHFGKRCGSYSGYQKRILNFWKFALLELCILQLFSVFLAAYFCLLFSIGLINSRVGTSTAL